MVCYGVAIARLLGRCEVKCLVFAGLFLVFTVSGACGPAVGQVPPSPSGVQEAQPLAQQTPPAWTEGPGCQRDGAWMQALAYVADEALRGYTSMDGFLTRAFFYDSGIVALRQCLKAEGTTYNLATDEIIPLKMHMDPLGFAYFLVKARVPTSQDHATAGAE